MGVKLPPAGDQLVDAARVVRVDSNRRLPVALVFRVAVVSGGPLVVEAAAAPGRCGTERGDGK
jgi:hypothetical protein